MPDKMGQKRCAIYTRKSSEAGLEQDFNSLDAQREAAEAYVRSQRQEGWRVIKRAYDDGGYSGGSLDRPALQSLLADVDDGQIDVIVVYKVDRLTRSLADFAKLIEIFDAHVVSFVSVTQQFNTTSSMGRLTLNVLLSFAQFEREVTGERIRDKIKASRAKGMWMGGFPPIGYDLKERRLHVDQKEAERVRHIFRRYAELKCVRSLKIELDEQGWRSRLYISAAGREYGNKPFARGELYHILNNRVYLGEAVHKGVSHPGEHDPIIDQEQWDHVQQTLAGNRNANTNGTRHASSSLLRSLLFDQHGNRMSPSHATKGGKRYRYYVSQPATIECAAHRTQVVERIPAHDIEQLVIDAVIADVRSNLDGELSLDGSAFHYRSLVRALVRKVTVETAKLRIEVTPPTTDLVMAILEQSGGKGERIDSELLAASGEVKQIAVPFTLTKRGGIVRIKTERADGKYLEEPHEPLMRAVVRAHYWRRKLERGEAESITDLAKTQGLTDRYVSRILRLAYLAPDLVEQIIDGRLAPPMPIEKLCLNVPLDWDKQRDLFAGTQIQ